MLVFTLVILAGLSLWFRFDAIKQFLENFELPDFR